MPVSEKDVSVIVPVYEQWASIPALLEALGRQDLAPHRFEIIVVDNGSANLPRADQVGSGFRLLTCEQPGSYAARNKALSVARGRVVAFTDADCVPAPDWLSKGLARMEQGGEQRIVAGRVRLVRLLPENSTTAAECYDLAMGFPQARYVKRGYGVTANLFVPRALFDRLGLFEAGRYSGGDAEFCRRAGRAGVIVDYAHAAVVTHPARRELSELIRKARRVKGGQLRNGPPARRLLYAARSFLPPVRAFLRIVREQPSQGCRRRVIAWVQGRLWLTEMAETLRLLLGAPPERR